MITLLFIKDQALIRLAMHFAMNIPDPQNLETQCSIAQRRRHAAHAKCATHRLAKLLKTLLVHYRRKCRHHRRFRQIPSRPFGRKSKQTATTFRIRSEFEFTPLRLAKLVANVNERAVGIKLDVPFGFLEIMADIGMLLKMIGNHACCLIGNVTDSRAGQADSREFFEGKVLGFL